MLCKYFHWSGRWDQILSLHVLIITQKVSSFHTHTGFQTFFWGVSNFFAPYSICKVFKRNGGLRYNYISRIFCTVWVLPTVRCCSLSIKKVRIARWSVVPCVDATVEKMQRRSKNTLNCKFRIGCRECELIISRKNSATYFRTASVRS